MSCRILLSLSVVVLFSCDNREYAKQVLRDYTQEEINYLYEVAFASANKNIALQRWYDTIRWSVVGDTTEFDRKLISRISKEVNARSLGIVVESARTPAEANLVFTFASAESLNLPTASLALTKNIRDSDFRIISSSIKVSKNISDTTEREQVIRHEVFHALGLIGHTLIDASDILYVTPSGGAVETHSENALRMLYQTEWPVRYTLANFEEDFSAALYAPTVGSALQQLVKTDTLHAVILEEILRYGMVKSDSGKGLHHLLTDSGAYGQLLRYPTHITVACTGEIPPGLTDSVKAVVREINSVTPSFQVYYYTDRVPSIDLHFIRVDTLPDQAFGAQVFFETSSTYDNNRLKSKKIVRSVINIYYGAHLHAKPGKIVGSILYKNLTLKDPYYLIDPFEAGTGFRLKQHYRDLLTVYYANQLTSAN